MKDIKKYWDAYQSIGNIKAQAFSETLADWIFELNSIDSYYAGIVYTVLGGGKPNAVNKIYIDELISQLEKIDIIDDRDRLLFESCKLKASKLKELVQNL